MYFLQNFDRSKTRFYQYVLYCFISIFPVFFHFLQTMHKKSALILIADTTPYKKIISTFFCASFVVSCIFILYQREFFPLLLVSSLSIWLAFFLRDVPLFYPLLERVFSSPTCFKYSVFPLEGLRYSILYQREFFPLLVSSLLFQVFLSGLLSS